MYSLLHSGLCYKRYAFCVCVHPCVIEWVCIRCLHEANTRAATVPSPGGLVSIHSPTFLITSFSYATHNLGLVDVQSNQNFKVEKVNWATSRWKDRQILLQKSRLLPLKVVPRTSPATPCSTNYCFKQKGELLRGTRGDSYMLKRCQNIPRPLFIFPHFSWLSSSRINFVIIFSNCSHPI